jgi:hypothetical protein
MRIRLFVTAALLAAAASVQANQDQKVKPKEKPPGGKAVITVTGCVEGSWLRVQAVDPSGSYAERYKLRGSKQLLKEIAGQYNKHLLEVTGAVTDTGDATHMGKTVQVGKKTRITTGAKEIPQIPTGSDATLDVQDFRELQPTCG